jgi:hypothetical protein
LKIGAPFLYPAATAELSFPLISSPVVEF